jgi:hypothetical protein
MISTEFAVVIITLMTTVCVAAAAMIHLAIRRLDRMQALYMSTIGTLVYMIAEAGDENDDEPTDEQVRPKIEEAKVLPFRNGPGKGSDDDSQ